MSKGRSAEYMRALRKKYGLGEFKSGSSSSSRAPRKARAALHQASPSEQRRNFSRDNRVMRGSKVNSAIFNQANPGDRWQTVVATNNGGYKIASKRNTFFRPGFNINGPLQ